MERNNRANSLRQLIELSEKQGYVTFDDIMNCADENFLSIGELDWLSETLNRRNIIIYETAPENNSFDEEEHDDFSQVDYEETFTEAERLCPNLKGLIDYIRKIVPPQRGEKEKIKYQVKEGNEHARERLTEMYLRTALRIAVSRAKAYDLDLEDTVQDAFTGLVIAVQKYDPDTNGPFNSFASFWIFQNVGRSQNIKNHDLYLPYHRKEQFFSIYPLLKERGCTQCKKIFYCEKAKKLVLDQLDDNEKYAHTFLLASTPNLALEKFSEISPISPWLIYYDDDMKDQIDDGIRNEEISEILDELNYRQKIILQYRYGFTDGEVKTLAETGKKFSITRERARQIEAEALRKIKEKCYKISLK